MPLTGQDLKELINEWTYAFDLDGGGYEFEIFETSNNWYLAWESPDLDYIGLQDIPGARDTDLLLVDPGPLCCTEPPWETPELQEQGYEKIAQGIFYEGDHECSCKGRWKSWSGAAGEPQQPEKISDEWDEFFWEFTGNSMDKPYPRCHRCNGDGYVTSPAGFWSLWKKLG